MSVPWLPQPLGQGTLWLQLITLSTSDDNDTGTDDGYNVNYDDMMDRCNDYNSRSGSEE